MVFKVNCLKENSGMEAKTKGLPSREPHSVNSVLLNSSRANSVRYNQKCIFGLCFGFWPIVHKTLGLSRVLSVLYVNEMNGGWVP